MSAVAAMAPAVIGVDLGTDGVRAIIVDAHTGVLSSATRDYPLLTVSRLAAESTT